MALGSGPISAEAKAEAARKHWSFQPIGDPAVPKVEHSDRVASPVDAFILAKLEAKTLEPSPIADRRTLIRRATFDLLGLPPTPAEVDAFLADESPEAFARVVDRLLASPRYGERWGRHWLDVARYADTKGYVFTAEMRYPYSYTYRDYVIRSFNEDKPYDRFVVEQIAADRLPLGDDKRPLAALGFLTVGRRFLNDNNEIIDDRIDVVTRGLMGLSVTCARCHDHKFDPIPTEDYYSLHGVFASSVEPAELPLLPDGVSEADKAAYDKERQGRLDKVERTKAEYSTKIEAEIREHLGAFIEAAVDDQFRVAGPQARRGRPCPQGRARAAPLRLAAAREAFFKDGRGPRHRPRPLAGLRRPPGRRIRAQGGRVGEETDRRARPLEADRPDRPQSLRGGPSEDARRGCQTLRSPVPAGREVARHRRGSRPDPGQAR